MRSPEMAQSPCTALIALVVAVMAPAAPARAQQKQPQPQRASQPTLEQLDAQEQFGKSLKKIDEMQASHDQASLCGRAAANGRLAQASSAHAS